MIKLFFNREKDYEKLKDIADNYKGRDIEDYYMKQFKYCIILILIKPSKTKLSNLVPNICYRYYDTYGDYIVIGFWDMVLLPFLIMDMFIDFILGVIAGICAYMLYSDFLGREKYIEYVRGNWIDESFSVPMYSTILILIIGFVIWRRKGDFK